MTAVVTCTLGDFQYIDEWITYHRNIGIDLFLIAYNGPYEKFSLLPKYDYVRYIDLSYSELPAFENIDRRNKKFTLGAGMQTKIVNYLLNIIKDIYATIDFAFAIDVDEFISFDQNKYKDINDFLECTYDKTKDWTNIPWVIYGGGDYLENDGRGLLTRFDYPTNSRVPFYRKHLRYNKVIIYIKHEMYIDNHIELQLIHFVRKEHDNVYDHHDLCLKHFYTKTVEEWIETMNGNNGERLQRLRGDVLYEFFIVGHNRCFPEMMRKIKEYIEKYNVDYKPEIEEKNDELRNLYIEANGIQNY